MKKLVIVIDGGMFSAAYTDAPEHFEDVEISVLDHDVMEDEYWTPENEQLQQMIDTGQLEAL